MNIETPRLHLVCCDLILTEIILKNNNELLSDYLGAKIPKKWTEFGEVAFKWTRDRLTQYPNEARWYSYLPILLSENTLVGSMGYKGAPDANGMVEIGYEIAEDFRQRGLAFEAAQALITAAWTDPQVTVVQAHTLAEENSSVRILRKCGMSFITEIDDPEDGIIWQWQLKRPK
jgi:[ribosomal protein S5]-alanine N-acetyltransferase